MQRRAKNIIFMDAFYSWVFVSSINIETSNKGFYFSVCTNYYASVKGPSRFSICMLGGIFKGRSIDHKQKIAKAFLPLL